MLDVTYMGALAAGLISFLSPCILPIVPFYLSYMAGVGMNQISANPDGTAVLAPPVRVRAVMSATLFSLGVITVFMAFGATASALGQLVAQYMDWMRMIAAALIVTMGLHFLGVFRIGILYRQFRSDAGETSNMSLLGSYVIGLAFAFGWTPCVGPVLAAILFTAATEAEGATRGATLLFAYGVGMTAPFILAAMFIGPFMRWMQGFRRHLDKMEKVMGAMLIIFGVLIGTNSMNRIAEWMLNYIPAMG